MHIPVLSKEVLRYLNPQPGETIIDCTLGLGGHAQMILEKIGRDGLYIGIEQDEANLNRAKAKLRPYKNIYFVRDNFENLSEIVKEIFELEATKRREQRQQQSQQAQTRTVNGILFDLGLSSIHIDTPERGFSFQNEGPLDMRFDTRQKMTASDLVNHASEKNLIFTFKIYGEEPHAKRIAQAIVEYRTHKRIETTTELAQLICSALRTRRFDPLARVFQALRIAVNRELEVFEKALHDAIHVIAPAGRIIVISFHSLEDRIAKHMFRTYSKELPRLSIQTKKPVRPSEAEIRENPRSRSARLRAAVRIL